MKDGLPYSKISSECLSALTCQSVIHIKTKTLNLLHGQTAVDKHSWGGGENNSTWSVSCFQMRLVGYFSVQLSVY